MKISVDNIELYSLNEIQKKVIKDYVHEDIFENDMKRRLHWVLNHLYDQAFKILKEQWEPKLKASGIKMIPTDNDEFAQMVFNHSDYKSRKQRDFENNI